MKNAKILEKLKNLENNKPGLAGKGDYGDEQTRWLASAQTAISEYDYTTGINFRNAKDLLLSSRERQHNCAKLMEIFFSTIEKISTQTDSTEKKSSGGVFGPGARYDFFLALREILASTEKEAFIIDPYIDASAIDGFLPSLNKNLSIRILGNKYATDTKEAINSFITQYPSINIKYKKTNKIHDRVVFIDKSKCWVLGASIKDAATTEKPTYIAPISDDIISIKLEYYQSIWDSATTV